MMRTTPEGILIVEDHPDTSAALVHLLTERGYPVITAKNGQEALDLLEGGARPQLILVDLMLPHVSGWDLLTYLQRDTELRFTPTIVMTGVPRDQVQVVADAVFSKPFDFSELTNKVDQLVKGGGVA